MPMFLMFDEKIKPHTPLIPRGIPTILIAQNDMDMSAITCKCMRMLRIHTLAWMQQHEFKYNAYRKLHERSAFNLKWPKLRCDLCMVVAVYIVRDNIHSKIEVLRYIFFFENGKLYSIYISTMPDAFNGVVIRFKVQ